jgi:hypothetical protein
MTRLKIGAAIAILVLGVFVALSPGLVYAPTPRIILYFLVASLPSLLFGAEATSRFEMKLPGFVFTTAGACAVCFGGLLLLNHLSKPAENIAVFHVVGETGDDINLDRAGVLKVRTTSSGNTVTNFVDKDTLVLIFPEQVGTVDIEVTDVSRSATYAIPVSYTGNRSSTIRMDRKYIKK